jgi:7-cyano-7-deazaguanine synthase
MSKHKVFCLLSGGADSTTTLAIARDEFPGAEFEAVTMDYGQRHKKEVEFAAYQATVYNAAHVVLNVQGLMTGMLIDKPENEAIPDVSYAELAPGISPTYVSFRNGLMLAVLTARAQTWIMEQEARLKASQFYSETGIEFPHTATIYCGVHADDGVNWAYPDCTPEFMGPLGAAIYVGTYHKVRLRTPLLFMTKPQVIAEGSKLGVNYANTWSCYKGEELQCGTCPTCRSRKEAFELNGLQDPTEYASDV